MQKEGFKMKRFDYSFLDNGLLPANLINITGTIYSLRTGAKVRKDEYTARCKCYNSRSCSRKNGERRNNTDNRERQKY